MYKILLTILLLTLAACTSPPDDLGSAQVVVENEGSDIAGDTVLAVDKESSSFEFEGYGVGKSHVGTFDIMQGSLTIKDGVVVGASGMIDAASVNTGIGGLDSHLKNEDFFHVEMYPTIEFESSSIQNGEMIGTLTFHGVTKEMVIPVTVDGTSLSSEFLLNMEDFGISYTGVNSEVRIAFELYPVS